MAFVSAAQLSLVMQNIFVVVCAAGIYVFLWYQPYLKTLDGNWQIPLYYAGIIILAIFSNLASLARMLAVERDWIVEICGKDKDMLAGKNFVFTTYDHWFQWIFSLWVKA